MAVDFICRVCGSLEFFSVRVPMESREEVAPWLFICRVCTSVFQDPKKFSLSVVFDECDLLRDLLREQSQLELPLRG